MRIKGIYFGAGVGATAYEIQVHRLYIRVMRPFMLTMGDSNKPCWGNIKRLITMRIVRRDQA